MSRSIRPGLLDCVVTARATWPSGRGGDGRRRRSGEAKRHGIGVAPAGSPRPACSRRRGSSGRRALSPIRAGRSDAKVTSRSWRCGEARGGRRWALQRLRRRFLLLAWLAVRDRHPTLVGPVPPAGKAHSRRSPAIPCRRTAGRTPPRRRPFSSSHLLRKVTRKAKPISPKISAFSAQVMPCVATSRSRDRR